LANRPLWSSTILAELERKTELLSRNVGRTRIELAKFIFD
jgi:hypothetical protein